MRRTLALLPGIAVLAASAPAPAHEQRTAASRLLANDAAATVATAERGSWCGDERASDDTTHAVRAAEHRLRALYLVPSDAPSRLADVAPLIQGSVDAASRTLETARGRALRFDRGTRCGAGYLDITTVRLGLTTAQLAQAAADGTTLAAVAQALRATGVRLVPDDELFTARRSGTVNVVGWLDAPAPTGTCGQATIVSDERRSPRNANAVGGKLALVFRHGESFCGSSTVLHEVAHLLGAVQDPAPHATADGHCSDAAEDVMCLPGSPALGAAGPVVDAGSDDYWDPSADRPLGWWTLNLSPFLCERPGCAGDRAAPRPTRRLRAVGTRRAFRR